MFSPVMSTPDEPWCTNWNCPPATELRETPKCAQPRQDLLISKCKHLPQLHGWHLVVGGAGVSATHSCDLFQMARRQSNTGHLLHLDTTCNAIWICLSHLEAHGSITSQTESIDRLWLHSVRRLSPYFSCQLKLRAAAADSISAWFSRAERSWTDTAARQNEKANHSHENKQ